MEQAKGIQTIILGIGNTLLGDEGIGVQVAKKMEKINMPSYVKVIDGATAGYSLLPILETYKNCKFLIVDAVKISDEIPATELSSDILKGEAEKENNLYGDDIYKNKPLSLIKKESIEKGDFTKNKKKGNSVNAKGDIYIIPLNELYNISKSDYPNLEFISFHQTGLMDVLTLLYMTSKIKIGGYLVGINIFGSRSKSNILNTFSMELSAKVKQKIPEIINILKKYI